MNGKCADLQLRTERLLLRPVNESDAAATAALVTEDVFQNLASWPYPMSNEQALERIRASRIALDKGSGLDFALTDFDGQLLGWIGLGTGLNEVARLGYWLGRPFRGLGFVKEAAAAFLPAAADALGVEDIVAYVFESNQASVRILHHLGFAADGCETLFMPSRERNEECLRFRLRISH